MQRANVSGNLGVLQSSLCTSRCCSVCVRAADRRSRAKHFDKSSVVDRYYLASRSLEVKHAMLASPHRLHDVGDWVVESFDDSRFASEKLNTAIAA
jgi:hypothetical protein